MPRKAVPLSGHFPGFSMYLFGMVSLPQPLLDWLLALQIQLEPQESVHISHVLAPLESWDSDAVQLQRADIFNWYLTPLLSFQIRHHHKQPILPPTSAWARMGMLHQCLTEVGSQLGWTFGGKQAHDSFESISPTQGWGICSDLLTARAGQTNENNLEMQPGNATYSSWQGTNSSLSQVSSLPVVAARQPQMNYTRCIVLNILSIISRTNTIL